MNLKCTAPVGWEFSNSTLHSPLTLSFNFSESRTYTANVNLLHQCSDGQGASYKPCRAVICKSYLGNCRVILCRLKQTALYNLFNYIFTFIFDQILYHVLILSLANQINWFVSAHVIICSAPAKVNFCFKIHVMECVHWNRKAAASNHWILNLVAR